MDRSTHNMNTLFAQLGLPNTDADVDRFIENHQLFTRIIPLSDATFWSVSQASFIRESLAEDSDWSELIDELDTRLRH